MSPSVKKWVYNRNDSCCGFDGRAENSRKSVSRVSNITKPTKPQNEVTVPALRHCPYHPKRGGGDQLSGAACTSGPVRICKRLNFWKEGIAIHYVRIGQKFKDADVMRCRRIYQFDFIQNTVRPPELRSLGIRITGRHKCKGAGHSARRLRRNDETLQFERLLNRNLPSVIGIVVEMRIHRNNPSVITGKDNASNVKLSTAQVKVAGHISELFSKFRRDPSMTKERPMRFSGTTECTNQLQDVVYGRSTKIGCELTYDSIRVGIFRYSDSRSAFKARETAAFCAHSSISKSSSVWCGTSAAGCSSQRRMYA